MKTCPICQSMLHDDDVIYIDSESWIVGCSQCIESVPITEVNIEDYTED